jgi:hypothetical protein
VDSRAETFVNLGLDTDEHAATVYRFAEDSQIVHAAAAKTIEALLVFRHDALEADGFIYNCADASL